jgi:nicotinate-nucleotide adenylyltransferase
MISAVFGGAFDPVHKEHVLLARQAVAELRADKLILVPTCTPPHKQQSEASFFDRVEMLKLAFKDFPVEVVFSDIEYESEGKSYSVDIIPKLKKQFGQFYYLIGGDSLCHFESWYNYAEIFKLTKLAVFDREGFTCTAKKIEEFIKDYYADITLLNCKGGNTSSSMLKTKLFLGEVAEELLPEVYGYIAKKKLYNKFECLVEEADKLLSDKKKLHSRNVLKEAVKVNSLHNLKIPLDNIFIAAMLHDVGYSDATALGVPQSAFGTAVAHQFKSAFLAAAKFGVEREEILEAIRFHCTGSPSMTDLEKLIYTADMISSEREFSGVDKLRRQFIITLIKVCGLAKLHIQTLA